MQDVSDLVERINAEFVLAEERQEELRSQNMDAYHDRQSRLETFSETLERLKEVWRPRLEALAQRFGDQVAIEPIISPEHRSVKFGFQSELAHIKLEFTASPDADVRNLIVSYNLQILPILMKFDSHDEISFPLENIDKAVLASWIDDRIISFLKTYLALHENGYYLKNHMVEDPIAKIRFPKFAAGAVLEEKGETLYFISEDTLQEFQQRTSTRG
jgi:YHS domain-containing protein